MKKMTFLLLFLLMAILCPATIITVDPNGSADYTTIQAAINDANDSDTVIVANGTYTGDGNRDIDFLGKAITVRSENGPANCTINCQGDPCEPHRGFYFQSGESSGSILDGITITNGVAYDGGGGVNCYYSSPIIKNCRITNCSTYNNEMYSPWGGGVRCVGGSQLFENCVIKNNICADPGRGGGVALSGNNSASFVNCLIINNTAPSTEYGGGISCKNATPKIINCTFNGNLSGRGGAIDLISSSATISNSILWGNLPQEIAMTATGSATVSYSDVQGGYSGVGNIDINPEFATLGDYHLVFGSPCIDAGTNSPPTGLPATDLDGLSRPFDGDFDDIAVADMGVYEFHADPNSPILALTPSRFRFTCPEGGPSPTGKILEVWNAGGSLLNWQIEEDCEWLEVDPNSGSSIGEIDEVLLSVDANDLSSDMYNCTLTVSNTDDSNDVRYVSIELRVGPILFVPSEHSTIQAAIDAAFDGDEIIVANGVYTGEGNRDIDFNGKAITVRSESYDPNRCIIDCQGSGSADHRGFYFHSSENKDSILDGFTIMNGYFLGGHLAEGGGIFCLYLQTDPTIRNCIIKGCRASVGGGIACYRGSPAIMNCIIIDNHASNFGGGIYFWDDSAAKITGCTISNNDTQYGGGGLYSGYKSNPTVTNCIIWDNSSNNGANEVGAVNASCTVSFSDVKGGFSGPGNINANPNFVDPASGDYHLKVTSPCIDSGDPDYNPAPEEWDIDVEPRVMGGRVDMGADEVSDMLADFDDNRVVDKSDLNILSEGWLGSAGQETWNEDCDTNQDGSVNGLDFLTLANSWLNETDSEAPSTPANLVVAGITTETVSLIWDTSTDNVGVAGYKVYRDGSYVGWSGSTNFTDEELESGTTYTYRVSAYDAEYNESVLSAACQASTSE